MNQKGKIEELYVKLYDGMLRKDEDLLDEILDGTFSLTHMTGMVQSKKAFIDSVTDGTLNYHRAEHQDIKVRKSGNVFFLEGRSLVRADVFGGSVNTWRLQLNLEIAVNNGKWLIRKAKASTY